MNRNLMICIVCVIFILSIPLSYSNGGCIKVADDVLVQLSISPLVPLVDKQTSLLISFANIQKELIKEEINGKLWITKDEETILTKDFKIKDGILDLKHAFKNPGLYEVFLEFNINDKTYAPEDFLIEVKEQNKNFAQNYIYLIVGILIGALSRRLIPYLRRQLNFHR
ncbi:hypothetical protein HYW99_03690 [Candidatus Woesearchaeota archaeon]|nr:hypothetical protein [Candidatus Woesearchaeota archaeon]